MSLRNPVKYPVKYYSWRDDQAPQLADADGVIKTILKACLVTGYGSKAGAGWAALFEDAYRIVLRRPLRTGNPPDIKIENGTVTGTTVRHRIVAQDNPTGLDDATELSAVNLLARDAYAGQEWYCIATDFAVMLCYQMGNNGGGINRNHVLYIGSMQKANDADADYFVCNYQTGITVGGTMGAQYPFMTVNSIIKNMRKNTDTTAKSFLLMNLAEKSIDNDYFAQKVFIDVFVLPPFFTALTSQYADKITSIISMNGRQFLRFVNLTFTLSSSVPVVLYIPLDYWEL